jgi:hypothetical protein
MSIRARLWSSKCILVVASKCTVSHTRRIDVSAYRIVSLSSYTEEPQRPTITDQDARIEHKKAKFSHGKRHAHANIAIIHKRTETPIGIIWKEVVRLGVTWVLFLALRMHGLVLALAFKNLIAWANVQRAKSSCLSIIPITRLLQIRMYFTMPVLHNRTSFTLNAPILSRRERPHGPTNNSTLRTMLQARTQCT